MVGNDEDVGFFPRLFLPERLQDERQISIGAADGGDGGFGAGGAIVLGEIGIAQPQEGESRELVAPQNLRQRARRISIPLAARLAGLG
jgi:hypothetical protein